MADYIEKIREVRKTHKVLKSELVKVEKNNKAIRELLRVVWDDDKLEKEALSLKIKLVKGRTRVKAIQIALRELKRSVRAYNSEYDCHNC